MPSANDIEAAYPVTIGKMTRVRDVYRLLTTNGHALCSKSYDIPEQEMHFIAQVMKHLAEAGFPYGPRIVSAKNNALWTTIKGKPHTITDWVRGRSPNFKERSEWKKAIRTLAVFHQHAKGIELSDVPEARNRYAHLQHKVASYRETIRENQKFGDMSPFISLCDDAIRCLDQPQCIEAIRNETSLLAFVHGDYNYRNLIIDKQGAIHLIDFENTSLQVRMVDLAHVLHRNVAWKGEETLRWIDNYDRVRPLSSEDRHLLFALLLVPYPLVRAIRQNRNIQSIQNAMPRTKMIEPYIHHLRKLI